jgi:hypothetical protein
MARVATSRNFLGFGKRKPARKKRKAVPKRGMFGWLTKKRETYHRDVGKERSELRREAVEQRRHEVELKKLRAQERVAEAAIAAADRKIEAAEKRVGTAEKQAAGGNITEARLDQIKAHMEREIEAQERHKAAVLAKNPGCARTMKSKVSDRAKRYRANQKGCLPNYPKKCKLCGSKSDVMIDHVDGNESNGRKSNLRWLCRSCNNTLGAEMAKTGQGRRTVQYNPAHKGALTLGEYMQAVLQHTRGAHDAAGKIIHETPKSRRREFASEIWARREAHGTARPGSSSAGYDEPDWVTNPGSKYKAYSSALLREMLSNVYPQQIGASDKRAIKKELDNRAKSNPAASAAQYRLAQAVLSGTARTPTRMTRTVAQEIVELTPAHLRSEYSRSNPNPPESTTEYRLGYSLGQMDRQNAALRRTDDELTATFKSEFFPDEWWKRCPIFISGYDDGFGFNGLAGGPTARNGGRQVNGGLPKRNPATASEDDGSEDYKNAKRIAELFHGRPVKEHLTVTETIRSHDWYAALGPLVELRIKAFKGAPFRTAKFKFPVKGDLTIQFFTSPDGKQFYLRGGDQEINLESLDMGPDSEWFRDSMLIGDVTYFVYRDGKKFHRFKITDYSHKVGSGLDSSGARHVQKTTIKPVMIYDSLSKKISFAGGLGKVETEDLVDGMSPGIVN